MGNGNLNCSATNCAYNNSGSCYSGGINVAGANATTTCNTACSSFQDKAEAGFTNCAGGCTCTKPDSINCQACNCKHNKGGSCKATNVKINAGNASCETFCCE